MFRREKFCRRLAWVWLIEQACWQDREINVNGETVTLKRGQLSHSLRFMADAWGWTDSRVRRFLGRLETDAAIDTAIDTGQTVITIKNYSKYQLEPNPADAPGISAESQQRRKEEGRKGTNNTFPNGNAPSQSDLIFHDGLNFLTGNGIPADRARSLLGKWRRDHGNDLTTGALRQAISEQPSDPIAYLTAILKTRRRLRDGPSKDELATRKAQTDAQIGEMRAQLARVGKIDL